MNYKKTAGLLILPALLFGSVSFAAELSINSIGLDRNSVTVSGTLAGESGRDILLYVSEEVENPEKSDVKHVAQVKTDEKGAFSVEFEMDGGDGDFFVYANSEQADSAVKKSFAFIGADTRMSLLNAINSAETAADMKSLISENAKICEAMGMSQKAEVSEELLKNRPKDGYTEENIVKEYNTLVFLKLINSTAKADEAKGFFETFPELIESRDAEAEKFIAEIICDNRPYSDISGFNAQYEKAAALNKINRAARDTMEKTLSDYAALLGYSNDSKYTEYVNAGDEKKVYITKAVVTDAANSKFKSSEDIIKSIKNAISAWNSQGNNGGGGNGGGAGKPSGNGGGKQSGGYAISTPEAGQNMEKKNEDKRTVFSDVGDNFWGREAILALADREILKGDGENFRPNDKITREEFVTVAVKAFGLYNDNAVCEFSDTPKDSWYYKYVASAYENKIISGLGDGYFGAGTPVTREDVAVILSRILGTKESSEPDFIDNADISDYAKGGVALMQSEGIIKGMEDGSFAPKSNCTRAEAATMVYKILKLQGGIAE